jgi:MarR family transcriptional regulator for hemolysin
MEFAGDIILQLMIAFRSLNGLITDSVEVSDIAQHYQVLMVLCRIGGAATQIELIRYLKMNESTLRASIQVLEKRGFVMRQKSNQDQRSHIILVTDRARQLMDKMNDVLIKVDQVAFRGLDQDQLFQLWTTVITINKNLASAC